MPARHRLLRGLRPGQGARLFSLRPGLRRSRGVVVQAVLLTVMVMAIGLLAVASRVYSSREGAA
ncbi:MAG: hypothetical protein VKN15_07540, partial [Cyanobacteriota bacterium]|nr:hypothetical protein [Cyanobacteriota bacterium]